MSQAMPTQITSVMSMTVTRAFVTALTFAALWLPGTRSPRIAPEPASKPVAVIAVASYERMLADLAFMGGLTGTPDLDKQIEGTIDLFTQNQGLAGFDRKRPFGLILTTDGVQFQPLILLPVTDLKKLLEVLEPLLGEAVEAADGVLELNIFEQTIYVKEQGGYGCLATSPDALNELPAQPGTLLGGLGKSEFAARLHIQNIPGPYRKMLIDQLRIGLQGDVEPHPGEKPAEFEARKKTVETQLEMLVKAVNDLEELTFGVALDTDNRQGHIDVQLAAVENSAAAKLFRQLNGGPSQFAGFVQESSASLNVTANVGQESTPQLVAGFKTIRDRVLQTFDNDARLSDANTRRITKDVLRQFFDAIGATLETGRIDAAAASPSAIIRFARGRRAHRRSAQSGRVDQILPSPPIPSARNHAG